MALVEIDWLHETPSVVKGLPRYPIDPDSYAYNITVSDPTPSLDAGFARTFAFGVDTPIPIISVPLGQGSTLDMALNDVYNDVYTSLSAYRRRVDYEVLPLHFERYSATDQARIRQRMDAISEQLRAGVDLEK